MMMYAPVQNASRNSETRPSLQRYQISNSPVIQRNQHDINLTPGSCVTYMPSCGLPPVQTGINNSDVNATHIEFDAWQLISNEFVKLDVIKCSICWNILRTPIFSYNDGGLNACEECIDPFIDDHKESAFMRNYALEDILNRLWVPCRFIKDGCCESRIRYGNLKNHEMQCRFRHHSCPTAGVTKCSWQGPIGYIYKHISDEHLPFIDNSNNAVIEFQAETLPCNDILKIFRFNKQIFLLYGEIDLTSKTLTYDVCQIKMELTSDYFYQYEAFNITGKLTAAVSDITSFTCPKSSRNWQKLSLTTGISLFIAICKNDDNNKSDDDETKKAMECPVCNEYMLLEIHQCLSGHSVCQICRSNVSQCPICRNGFGQAHIRNYLVENLTKTMSFSCKYKHLGCTEQILGALLPDHQKACLFKDHNCPFPNCGSVFTSPKLIDHLKSAHTDLVVLGNPSIQQFRPLTNSKILCLIVSGNIYKITVCDNKLTITNVLASNTTKSCFKPKIIFVDDLTLDQSFCSPYISRKQYLIYMENVNSTN